MRRDVILLTDRVREFERGRDIDDMRILNLYDHIVEDHDQIQS